MDDADRLPADVGRAAAVDTPDLKSRQPLTKTATGDVPRDPSAPKLSRRPDGKFATAPKKQPARTPSTRAHAPLLSEQIDALMRYHQRVVDACRLLVSALEKHD
jgi:hypothetical protein